MVKHLEGAVRCLFLNTSSCASGLLTDICCVCLTWKSVLGALVTETTVTEAVLCILRLGGDHRDGPVSAGTWHACCSRDPRCKMRCCCGGLASGVCVVSWKKRMGAECGGSLRTQPRGVGWLGDLVGNSRQGWQDTCRAREELAVM